MRMLEVYNKLQKISSSELCEKFREYNKGVWWADDKRTPLKALVLLKQECYRKEIPEEDRIYEIDSHNKMFYSDTLGYSCFGHGRIYDDRLEGELTTGEGVQGIVLLPN